MAYPSRSGYAPLVAFVEGRVAGVGRARGDEVDDRGADAAREPGQRRGVRRAAFGPDDRRLGRDRLLEPPRLEDAPPVGDVGAAAGVDVARAERDGTWARSRACPRRSSRRTASSSRACAAARPRIRRPAGTEPGRHPGRWSARNEASSAHRRRAGLPGAARGSRRRGGRRQARWRADRAGRGRQGRIAGSCG